MEIEAIKRLIRGKLPTHSAFQSMCEKTEKYYHVENDILYRPPLGVEDESNLLHNADNRVPSSFYNLLVDQKTSYMFTQPPAFDVGNKMANKKINEILGDEFAKNCQKLCTNASNCGVAWLHFWKDEDNNFQYGIVNSQEIIPIWSSSLKPQLLAVLRMYQKTDESTGEKIDVYEYWTDNECYSYFKKSEDNQWITFTDYPMFPVYRTTPNFTEFLGNESVLTHSFGEVPFIAFYNNSAHTTDLKPVKGLIDTYDKTFSGYINDLEDIQEVILILTGYGGTDLTEFLSDMKKYKSIKIDEDAGQNSGVQTLTIDIPVEARNTLLQLTRKSIFEQGKGIDPDPQNFGNSSGVALSYLYSLLELKAGLTQSEFELGFARLIRAIGKLEGLPVSNITQTWKRTSVSNDAEKTDIINKSISVLSERTLLENHPFVSDAEEELKRLKKQREQEQAEYDMYKDLNHSVNKYSDEDDDQMNKKEKEDE